MTMWTVFLWFLTFLMTVFILVKIGVGKPFLKAMLNKFLAWDTARFAKKRNQMKEIIEMNKELFSSMGEVIKNIGGPVLELGAGSGANLEYYPAGAEIIAIDLNDNFKEYLEKSFAKNNHVKLHKRLLGNVEDMRGLVADNSCSCVVSSLLLCCADQQKTLPEIMRVLKPGGRFYFIEHIAERQGTWVRFIQELMKDTWASLRQNCTVTKNTDEVISNFGFDQVTAKIVYRPLPWLFSFAKRTYVGYATKTIENE